MTARVEVERARAVEEPVAELDPQHFDRIQTTNRAVDTPRLHEALQRSRRPQLLDLAPERKHDNDHGNPRRGADALERSPLAIESLYGGAVELLIEVKHRRPAAGRLRVAKAAGQARPAALDEGDQ